MARHTGEAHSPGRCAGDLGIHEDGARSAGAGRWPRSSNCCSVGNLVNDGDLLLISERLTHDPRGLDGKMAQAFAPPVATPGDTTTTTPLRADLQRLIARQAFTQDASRAGAWAERHAWAFAVPARTLPICATPEVLWNTAPWLWRRSAAGAPSRTWWKTPRRRNSNGHWQYQRPPGGGDGLRRHRAGRHPRHA